MQNHYHYREKPKEKRRWRWAFLTFVLLLLIIGGAIGYDIYRGRSQPQSGAVQTSQLTFDDKKVKLSVSEPTFKLQLPSDWKELSRRNTEYENSITWQATKAKQDNRFMTIYIDRLPATMAYNRLLPVEAVGAGLRHGEISDNCATFTPGGSLDAAQAAKTKETPAKWEEITFICDLPKVFDNVIGTSSQDGINKVNVTGPSAGKHTYFFLYTDHNNQPDYQIFTDIISSFQAI